VVCAPPQEFLACCCVRSTDVDMCACLLAWWRRCLYRRSPAVFAAPGCRNAAVLAACLPVFTAAALYFTCLPLLRTCDFLPCSCHIVTLRNACHMPPPCHINIMACPFSAICSCLRLLYVLHHIHICLLHDIPAMLLPNLLYNIPLLYRLTHMVARASAPRHFLLRRFEHMRNNTSDLYC